MGQKAHAMRRSFVALINQSTTTLFYIFFLYSYPTTFMLIPHIRKYQGPWTYPLGSFGPIFGGPFDKKTPATYCRGCVS